MSIRYSKPKGGKQIKEDIMGRLREKQGVGLGQIYRGNYGHLNIWSILKLDILIYIFLKIGV